MAVGLVSDGLFKTAYYKKHSKMRVVVVSAELHTAKKQPVQKQSCKL